MTLEQREEIRQAYLTGMTLVEVGQIFRWASQRELRQCLEGIIRPKTCQRSKSLSEEEVAQRREAIKASWTTDQARSRWVGRYLSRPETLGSCLSRALRELGGDG